MDPAEHRTIASIYAAGLDGTIWASVLAELARASGASAGAMFYFDDHGWGEQIGIGSVHGYSDRACLDYKSYFITRNLDRLRLIRAKGVGGSWADDHDVDFGLYADTELFVDFYRPQHLGRAMCFTLFDDQSRAGMLSLHRELGAPAYTKERIEALNAQIQHVRVALKLSRQMGLASRCGRLASIALDHFPTAVWQLDADGRVLGLNRAAEAVVQRPDGALMVRGGRLHGRDAAADRVLHAQIQGAISVLRGNPAAANRVVTLVAPQASERLAMLIAPVPAVDFVSDSVRLPTDRGDGAVLVFASERRSGALNRSVVQALFGMTAAEASVAEAIAQGWSPEQIASERDVQVGTVRVQLRSIFAKLGVSRQAEACVLLQRSIAAVGRPSQVGLNRRSNVVSLTSR